MKDVHKLASFEDASEPKKIPTRDGELEILPHLKRAPTHLATRGGDQADGGQAFPVGKHGWPLFFGCFGC